MAIAFCNQNLPDVFADCRAKNWGIYPDKLPQKNSDQNALLVSDFPTAITYAHKLGGKHFSAIVKDILHNYFWRARKWQYESNQYFCPYECRFDSNETLANDLDVSSKTISRAINKCVELGILETKQFTYHRIYCLGPTIIKLAKMSIDEKKEYVKKRLSKSNSNTCNTKNTIKVSQKEGGQLLSTQPGQLLSTQPGQLLSKQPGQLLSTELNKLKNKEINHIVNQPPTPTADAIKSDKVIISNFDSWDFDSIYDPDADAYNNSDESLAAFLAHAKDLQNDSVVKSDNKQSETTDNIDVAITHKTHDQDKSNAVSRSIDHIADPSSHSDHDKKYIDLANIPIHKKDVVNAWRSHYFAKNEKGEYEYRQIGADFFEQFYDRLSTWLLRAGHNKRTYLIPVLAERIFDNLFFGANDNKYKLDFESWRFMPDLETIMYLKTNSFKTLLKQCYQSIDINSLETLEASANTALVHM